MDKAAQIEPQNWMTDPATRKVMDVLGEEEALFVGGCVRNTLLVQAVEDIDIATKHEPDAVMKLLNDSGIKTIPTGIDHGTLTAVIDKQSFEITTLRKDVETDGRRAVIEFSKSWEEDAQRRDFTMNTLLANTKGEIFDPTGQGLDDLRAGRIVFVGDAEQRMQEDILRILRFFRFHALYGKAEPEDKILALIAKYADKIPELSRERITQEFLKILSVDNPVDILRIMFDNAVLKDFEFPETDLETLAHLCEFQNRYALGFIASRLFALAGFSQDNIIKMETLLLLPKVFKKDIEAIDSILQMQDLKTEQAVKEAIYRHGRVACAQALMIELTTDRVMNGYAPTALEIVQNWDIPNFPLTGEDLIIEGFKPGPELGDELTRREEMWIKNDFI